MANTKLRRNRTQMMQNDGFQSTTEYARPADSFDEPPDESGLEGHGVGDRLGNAFGASDSDVPLRELIKIE
jgi:hypothetical protein